jgi:hypothetical protein
LENKVVLNFGDFGGQGCPHILVILYWLGGMVFPSRISDVNKITELKLCLMCIDDSSMIFCVSAAYVFQSIIFSVKLFSDNN